MKFNRVRISEAGFEGKSIPCVYWQTDEMTPVEIRYEPINNNEPPLPGVILDLDWPLAAHPAQPRKETLC
jgi:hypothetical protein